MANQNGRNSAPNSNHTYRWLAFLVALALMLSAAWAQPVGAGSGLEISGIPAPSAPITPLQAFSFRSYNFQTPVLSDGPTLPVAPLPNLGGTCVSGYLIDSYHKPLGAGWEITLTPEEEGPSQTTTSGADGKFSFNDLGAGTYIVELKMIDGWRPFTPTKFPVTLSGVSDGCAQVRYKLEALPCIKVIKLDAGGEVNGQLAGIPGWGFTATQGNLKVSAKTDGQGLAYFYNLLPGMWTVTEEEKVGWRPAKWYSNAMDLNLYPPEVPGTCQVALFVNEQVNDACIVVKKFDVAGNPVPGWNIALARNDGTQPPASALTDAAGEVTFSGLALGDWTVTEEVREWWRPVGETSAQVELDTPGFCKVVDFVNEPLGCVDGYKINHLEQGLPGWKIDALNEDTGQQFSTVTDPNGYFYFNQLSLGTWLISEELQPGWEPVTQPEFTVEVTEPFKCETVRFKNRTNYACVDIYKRDSIDGIGLPGWKITLQPAFGGEPLTGTTDGTGWVRFEGLTPGTYNIKEEVSLGWTAVSPEQVTVELAATGSCSEINFCNIQTHMIPPEKYYPPKDKPSSGSCPLYYTVKPGDTLWSIGQRFDVPANAIARVNRLKNPSLIYPGTRLCIPLGDP